jgi:Na+/glutamate symporter
MEWLIVLVIGVIIGALFAWFGLSIRAAYKHSKDLRSSSERARKAQKDQALKAKQDAKKARDAGARVLVQVMLLVIAIVFVAWLAWTVVQF